MIQYIQVETDDDGTIVGLGFDSTTGAYSAVKKVLSETSGLPQDASTKDHIAKITSELSRPYLLAKQKLAAESGLEDFCTVEEHLAAIKSKARLGGISSGREYTTVILAKHSGLDQSNAVGDHIAAIQLKAYDQGYDKGWSDKQADFQKRIKQFEDAIKETIENE